MTTLPSLIEQELRAFKADWKSRDQARATLVSYERHLRKYFAHAATLSLTEAREHLLTFTSKHEARTAARALKAYSKWYADEYDETDAMAKLRLPKEPVAGETRIATDVDTEAILAVCKGTGDERWLGLRDHAIISVLASTGMRRSELSRMKLADVDMAEGTIFIPLTKNGESRVVQMTEAAVRSLARYRRNCEDTFPDVWLTVHGTPLSSEAIRRAVERRAKMAGVDVTSHSFRRGLALNWLNKGGSETLLRTQAGWKSPAMVARYVKSKAQAASLAEHKRLFNAA